MNTRRSFIKHAGLLAGGTMVTSALLKPVFGAGAGGMAASDRINIGAIGINGMGWSDLNAALKQPGVEVVALCDIDKNVLDKRMKDLSKLNINTSKIKTTGNYQDVLNNKDVDAVIIGTPDHWHALIMMEACAAGKDVYVEKPVGNSIGECRAMVAAQKKYNRVVQGGQWQRSQQHFQDAIAFVHSGQLGNIRTVKVWCYQDWMKPGPRVPDSAPPAGVDYKTWLGPAPDRSFNYQETPDTLTALYEFDHFNMVWDHAMGIGNGPYGRDHGIAFIGNNATLVLSRNGWEVIDENTNKNKIARPLAKPVDDGLLNHWKNFTEVVRSRNMEDLHCNIQAGALVATVAQLGNISLRSGKRLVWSGDRFTDETVNKEYLMKAYHNGYTLPVV